MRRKLSIAGKGALTGIEPSAAITLPTRSIARDISMKRMFSCDANVRYSSIFLRKFLKSS
jgi:hypothetical protein